MALRAGRVGVNPSEVDTNGKILSSGNGQITDYTNIELINYVQSLDGFTDYNGYFKVGNRVIVHLYFKRESSDTTKFTPFKIATGLPKNIDERVFPSMASIIEDNRNYRPNWNIYVDSNGDMYVENRGDIVSTYPSYVTFEYFSE